jgi:cytochrome c peroxidase
MAAMKRSWVSMVMIVLIMVLLLSMGTDKLLPYPFPTMKYFPEMPVAPDNPVTQQGAELGRSLFYDPLLSADGSLSCASCHQQRYAFSDGPRAFSTGMNGSRMHRNTPALFNLAWYPAFFWDGRSPSLEDQVLHPVRDARELGAGWAVVVERLENSEHYRTRFKFVFGDVPLDSTLVAKAIAQYLRTLISADSKYDRVLRGEATFSPNEFAGFVIANEQNKGDCLQCHTTDRDALGTTRRFSNNGLDAARDPMEYHDPGRGGFSGMQEERGQFKIPSLRNVGLTAPYMHDGRFATLEDVISFYSDSVHAGVNIDPRMGTARQGGAHLSPLEQQQLLAFLHTLTDSSFITDTRHGDPLVSGR